MGGSGGGAFVRSWLPVLRLRRRYIAFEVFSEKDVSKSDLLAAIRSAEITLYGDIGSSMNLLRLIYFDGSFGLLRCALTRIDESRAALATIYSINRTRVAIRVLGVSGTIKAATEKYIPELPLRRAENVERKIELEQLSGWIVRINGWEVDLTPDDQEITKRSDTQLLGLTSFDLYGGMYNADDASDGI